MKKNRAIRIRARILAGEKFREIANSEKVTVSYVSKVRAQFGIPRRIKPR